MTKALTREKAQAMAELSYLFMLLSQQRRHLQEVAAYRREYCLSKIEITKARIRNVRALNGFKQRNIL
jgi:3'-phosphoadenosine 5'-phosphosulfate sulfotransferase